MHHFTTIREFKPELQSRKAQFGSNRRFLVPCDLEICWITLKNNRTPFWYHFKLCASFHNHWWIKTWVKSPKTPNLGKNRQCLVPCDLEIWWMTLKTNRVHPLYYIKLCESFHSIYEFKLELQSGNTQIWAKFSLTSVTLTFQSHLPWPLAWTSLLAMAITPENFTMIRWEEHSEKCVLHRKTDGRVEEWT